MNPHELTTLLTQAGALQKGSVSEIQTTKNEAFNSHTHHLQVRYSADASPHLPSELILKQNVATDWGREDGQREVAFYRLFAQDAHQLSMIIPHFVAIDDETTGDSLLLLKDLSTTHRLPITRQQQINHEAMPAAATLYQIVETLARFHAAWWDTPQLGNYPFELDPDFQDKTHFQDYTQTREQNWQACLATEGHWLPQDIVHDINTIVRLLPRAWDRYLSQRFPTRHQLTVTHNDAYLCNFLVPQTEGTGNVFMMDWQSPCTGIGAYDLVMMCASFWTPQQRQEHKREETMLRHYLATLHAQGVTSYTWELLVADYRWMILFFLHVAIWDQTSGSLQSYWWPKLQCLMSAARDHDSLSLLL